MTADIWFLFLVFTIVQLFKLLIFQIYSEDTENTICSLKLEENTLLFRKMHSVTYVVGHLGKTIKGMVTLLSWLIYNIIIL